MRDMMQQVDSNLLIPVPDRSNHNLDQKRTTTLRFGEITPVLCMETIPGGKYTLRNETLVRFQPLVAPIMEKMVLKVHYWFIPNRIVWDGWENFSMNKPDPLTGLVPAMPTFFRSRLTVDPNTGAERPRLCNQLGYKRNRQRSSLTDVEYNALPLAAYQKVYNRHYRHKLLKPEVTTQLVDGEIGQTLFDDLSTIRKITFKDDYFNVALPSPQLGEPVFVDNDAPLFYNETNTSTPFQIDDDGGNHPSQFVNQRLANTNDNVQSEAIYARVRIIVEEIRRATKLQEFVEMQRHAQTYQDYLKAYYNVELPDFRVQQPEFIGGAMQNIIVSDVTNMSDLNQGKVVGRADGYAEGRSNTYYAHEAGIILGVAFITYDPSYIEAQPRLFFKTSWDEFYNPMFQTLGEQAIYQGELSGSADDPKKGFGYVPRYHEYRSSFNTVTDEAATILSHWHLARNLDENPVLTESFIEVNDERRIFVFQDPNSSPAIVQCYHDIKANLPIAKVASPTL